MKNHFLKKIKWPSFGFSEIPPQVPLSEYQRRLQSCRNLMSQKNLSHLVVYADREHFANLCYLTGFDPRFEESILIIPLSDTPLLLTGNECFAYVDASPLLQNKIIKKERYQTFSLLNQPRSQSRNLELILKDCQIKSSSRIGCVGTKYFSTNEFSDNNHTIDIPTYITDILRKLSSFDSVINATDLFMHPGYGLRSTLDVHDIAFLEYTNGLASEGVKNMLFHFREGISDFELAKHFNYNGIPLGCHLTFVTDKNHQFGLSGPCGAIIKKGSEFATNFCYWGSNVCRAGWVVNNESELPIKAKDYVKDFAGKYFEVMHEWFQMMQPGVKGGEIFNMIHKNLPDDVFGIFLNPGHLIHLDEWLSSPIYQNSDIPLHSGMAMQVDIIPCSEKYFSTRMEDGIVIADDKLQKQIKETYPQVYSRCLARKKFMSEELGFDTPKEVLPLSNMTAIVNPFMLNPELVFALK